MGKGANVHKLGMRIRSVHPPHLICAFPSTFLRPVLRVEDVPHRFVPAKGIACESEDAIEILIFRLDELDAHLVLFFFSQFSPSSLSWEASEQQS